jgi:hypothetical protein
MLLPPDVEAALRRLLRQGVRRRKAPRHGWLPAGTRSPEDLPVGPARDAWMQAEVQLEAPAVTLRAHWRRAPGVEADDPRARLDTLAVLEPRLGPAVLVSLYAQLTGPETPPPTLLDAREAPAPEVPGAQVVAPGQEALVRRMLTPPEHTPPGWLFEGAAVGATITARYRRGAERVVLTLLPPLGDPRDPPRTRHFRVQVRSSAPHPDTARLLDVLLDVLRANEHDFRWTDPDDA